MDGTIKVKTVTEYNLSYEEEIIHKTPLSLERKIGNPESFSIFVTKDESGNVVQITFWRNGRYIFKLFFNESSNQSINFSSSLATTPDSEMLFVNKFMQMVNYLDNKYPCDIWSDVKIFSNVLELYQY